MADRRRPDRAEDQGLVQPAVSSAPSFHPGRRRTLSYAYCVSDGRPTPGDTFDSRRSPQGTRSDRYPTSRTEHDEPSPLACLPRCHDLGERAGRAAARASGEGACARRRTTGDRRLFRNPVVDRFRFMESRDVETTEWMNAQGRYTRRLSEAHERFRQPVRLRRGDHRGRFKDLYAMDVIQHVREGVRYPAFLITGGLDDPRRGKAPSSRRDCRRSPATGPRSIGSKRVRPRARHGQGDTRCRRGRPRGVRGRAALRGSRRSETACQLGAAALGSAGGVACRSATSRAKALSELGSSSAPVSGPKDVSSSRGFARCCSRRARAVCSAARTAIRRLDSAISACRVSAVM